MNNLKDKQIASGRATAAKLGPEGRTERAKAGAAARWGNRRQLTSDDAIYYHASMPNHLIVRDANGEYWIAPNLMLANHARLLTPYKGYRKEPPLMPVPEYIARFYRA